MIDIARILTEKYPDSHWRMNGDGYENLEWISDDPKPSQQEIQQLATQVDQERSQKRDKLQQLRDEIRNTPPPQSVPGLSLRVEKIEQILGLRDLELDED